MYICTTEHDNCRTLVKAMNCNKICVTMKCNDDNVQT